MNIYRFNIYHNEGHLFQVYVSAYDKLDACTIIDNNVIVSIRNKFNLRGDFQTNKDVREYLSPELSLRIIFKEIADRRGYFNVTKSGYVLISSLCNSFVSLDRKETIDEILADLKVVF